MHTLFTEVTEGKKEEGLTLENKKAFLEKIKEFIRNSLGIERRFTNHLIIISYTG